jgi:hypothetical protein
MMHIVVHNSICLSVHLNVYVRFLNDHHGWSFWFGSLLCSDGVGINELTHFECEVVVGTSRNRVGSLNCKYSVSSFLALLETEDIQATRKEDVEAEAKLGRSMKAHGRRGAVSPEEPMSIGAV